MSRPFCTVCEWKPAVRGLRPPKDPDQEHRPLCWTCLKYERRNEGRPRPDELVAAHGLRVLERR